MIRRIVLVVLFAGVLIAGAGPGTHQAAASGLLATGSTARLATDLFVDPVTGAPVPADGRIAAIVQLSGPTAFDLYEAQLANRRLDLAISADRSATVSAPDEALAEDRIRAEAFTAVADRQQPVATALDRVGAERLSTYTAAANGFLVYLTREQAAALGREPGVKAILRAPYFLPQVEDAVPMIGADAVAAEYGYTGRDVTIAVIDTGIDYTHKSLGGSGRTTDFTTAYNSPATIQRDLYPNDKVIGGYDFAGSAYNGGNQPQPDANPLDEFGHGTHVSGIAAGERNNRLVGHGVAPDAKLIALKVFGRQGGTNLTTDALDWAVKVNMGEKVDGECRMTPRCRVDVVNMSLGAAFAEDVLDQMGVIKRATDAGIVVVASAGNDYDVGFITGSPAASPQALSVASTVPQGEKADQIQILGPDGSGELLEAIEATGNLAAQMKDVKNLRAHLAWMGLACAGQQPEQDVKDKIALVELGSCGAPAKLASALAFGAVGVLAYQENTLIDQLDGQPKTDLPAFMISGQDALTLRDRLSDGEDLEAVLSYQWHESLDRTYLDDTISSFSSRGPSRLGVFKPNISGPGTNIHAPKMGSGDNGTVLSGTSMASPLVAGAAAVAVDRARSEGLAEADQPLGSSEGDLSAVDIASLLVNGADMTVWQDDNRNEQPVALARGGAGRVDLVDSAHLTTLLEADTSGDHPERTPYGISFGLPTFISPRNETAPFLLRNLSDHDRTYRLETSFIFEDDAASGVTLTPSEDTVDVPAGGTAQLNLDLDLDPAGMKRYTAYGGNAAMVASKLTDAEHDAYLVATEVDGAGAPVDGGDLVRLPVYVLPRAASALAFEGGEISVDADTGKGTGNVANAGQQPGRGELFVPVGEDDTEPNMKPGIDIDHVGVRLGRDVAGERTIEFLVHTRGPASVPLDRRAIVAIDVNRDGAMDWVVINEDNGRWPWNRYPRPNGNQVAVLTQVAQPRPLSVSVNPGIYKAEYFAGVDLESRAVILPVRASSLGFGDGDTIAFDIAVAVQDIFKDRLDGKTWSALDSAPDGAWDAAGLTGGAAYRFDESALDYSVGAWSFNVGPGTSFGVHVSLKGIDDGTPPSPLLAYFPLNGPDESRADDLAVVPVVVRSGPRPTSTPDTAGSRVFLPALKDEANP